MSTATTRIAERYLAEQRFGLGRRGDAPPAEGEARDWLRAQLHAAPLPPALRDLARTGPEALFEPRARKDEARRAQRVLGWLARYRSESALRFSVQLASERPLFERLVLFFSNHFTVSIQKPVVAGLANRFEIEAIRPHLLGRFEDLVLATARHPAMLLYLDNAQSVGPDSRAGRRRERGLNENYARELMELHTLGVDGGYTQDDVIALARILTGWSLQRGRSGPETRYAFRPELHQPGDKTLLGRRYAESGEDEGIAALTALARHSATARHLCTKLAAHFISDTPPPSLIARLTRAWQASDGELAQVVHALIEAPEAWATPLSKLRGPYEFALASLRLTGLTPTPEQILGGLDALNARPFNAGSPAGDSDAVDALNGSDALHKRVVWAHRLAQRLPAPAAPVRFAEAALGPLLGAHTRLAISRAASASDALALLLASPEFQRR